MPALRLQFGRAVRRLRSAKGFSQEAFADAVGVHRTYMGAVERGETNISLDNVIRIAEGLAIKVSTLFAEAEHESATSERKATPRPHSQPSKRRTRGDGGR
jgi:transcriptional regulator with XRE-family HTH domain